MTFMPHRKWNAVAQVKAEAKRIKRERGITHSHALEILAEQYGYMDWNHLRAVLKREPKGFAGPPTFHQVLETENSTCN